MLKSHLWENKVSSGEPRVRSLVPKMTARWERGWTLYLAPPPRLQPSETLGTQPLGLRRHVRKTSLSGLVPWRGVDSFLGHWGSGFVEGISGRAADLFYLFKITCLKQGSKTVTLTPTIKS